MPFYPKITAKQEGGDDGYCYVIRIDGKEFVNGLTRPELTHYKGEALLFWYSRRLREVYLNKTAAERQDLARSLIKLNIEYNYKTPRKPIEYGCCSWTMEVEHKGDELKVYCPLHGESLHEVGPKAKEVPHVK